MGDRQVAVVGQNDAVARALAVIKAHPEAVSFVRQEDIDAQGMFLPVVSVVGIVPADLHDLAGGMVMPKKHHVDRMAEAAGVNVTAVDVQHPSRYVWTAKAHGSKRMPDGSMREGEGEYSFDAEAYAELDFLKDGNKGQPKYTSEKSKQIHLLEYAKFGHQRASTGARLALIRFFCKCPTAFKREDVPKAMIFSRIDVNSDGMLQAPEMRQAALSHALGAQSALFGPRERNVTSSGMTIDVSEPEPVAASEPDDDPFADSPDPEPVVDTPTPEEKAREALKEWAEHDAVKSHAKAAALVREALDNKSTTLEALNDLIKRCQKLEKARGA